MFFFLSIGIYFRTFSASLDKQKVPAQARTRLGIWVTIIYGRIIFESKTITHAFPKKFACGLPIFPSPQNLSPTGGNILRSI